MKGRVLKSSPLGLQIQDLFDRGKNANSEAKKAVASLGIKQWRSSDCRSVLLGGVSSLLPPEGFDRAGYKKSRHGKGELMPRKDNKPVFELISNLPVVKCSELNDLLVKQYEDEESFVPRIFSNPGIETSDPEYFYFDFPEAVVEVVQQVELLKIAYVPITQES